MVVGHGLGVLRGAWTCVVEVEDRVPDKDCDCHGGSGHPTQTLQLAVVNTDRRCGARDDTQHVRSQTQVILLAGYLQIPECTQFLHEVLSRTHRCVDCARDGRQRRRLRAAGDVIEDPVGT